jgi:hypothetical protein
MPLTFLIGLRMSKREPQVIAKDVNERYHSVKWPKDLLKFIR